MMVETEHTPNPNTLKFLPGKKVSEVGPIEFLKNDKNIKVSLANKILSLEGTVMVFFGEDFITVKKEQDINWEDLKHGIISEINDYYSKGNTIVLATAHPSKFSDVAMEATGIKPELPENLKNILVEKENYDKLPKDLEKVKNYILERA